jgi:hypothetical protein
LAPTITIAAFPAFELRVEMAEKLAEGTNRWENTYVLVVDETELGKPQDFLFSEASVQYAPWYASLDPNELNPATPGTFS